MAGWHGGGREGVTRGQGRGDEGGGAHLTFGETKLVGQYTSVIKHRIQCEARGKCYCTH